MVLWCPLLLARASNTRPGAAICQWADTPRLLFLCGEECIFVCVSLWLGQSPEMKYNISILLYLVPFGIDHRIGSVICLRSIYFCAFAARTQEAHV